MVEKNNAKDAGGSAKAGVGAPIAVDPQRALAREWADANGFLPEQGQGSAAVAIDREDPVWLDAWEGRDEAVAAAGVGAGSSPRLLDHLDPVKLAASREGFLSWLRGRAPQLWSSGYDAALLADGSRWLCSARELLACARAGADFEAPAKGALVARALELSARGWQGPATDLLSQRGARFRGAAVTLATGMLSWPEAGEALAASLQAPQWTRPALGRLSSLSSRAKGDGAGIVRAAWERACLEEARPRAAAVLGSKPKARI